LYVTVFIDNRTQPGCGDKLRQPSVLVELGSNSRPDDATLPLIAKSQLATAPAVLPLALHPAPKLVILPQVQICVVPHATPKPNSFETDSI